MFIIRQMAEVHLIGSPVRTQTCAPGWEPSIQVPHNLMTNCSRRAKKTRYHEIPLNDHKQRAMKIIYEYF